jgi:hypothetical protein
MGKTGKQNGRDIMERKKPVIYVSQTQNGSYWKITATPCAHQNLGIIENNGYLNARDELIAMILQAGGNFENEPGYTPSQNGATHGVGGVGYIGYVHYDNCMDAIVYLLRYFTIIVVKCH